jgi:molybdopterin-guanine dinucleotide biosynthesis protein A
VSGLIQIKSALFVGLIQIKSFFLGGYSFLEERALFGGISCMADGNPAAKQKIAGVVLAGGKSSRMGRDKAVLPFHGRPLIDHMTDILREAGCDDVFIGGQRAGYPCIPDQASYQGPAVAMRHVLQELRAYRGVLFVPVDMPLLTAGFLQQLLMHEKGAFFEGRPLPACIISGHVQSEALSVHGLLSDMGISPIPCCENADRFFVNLNTPEEWRKVMEK